MLHRVSVYIVCVTAMCSILWYAQGQRSLDIDYLYGVARYAPPFGIAGTDPDALREAVKNLAHTRLLLGRAQHSIEDAYYVYRSLYPLPFLFALADLEEARHNFLIERTSPSARAYLRQLTRVGKKAESDIRRQRNARLFFSETSTVLEKPIYSFGGVHTERTMIADSEAILSSVVGRQDDIKRIILCAKESTCTPPERTPYTESEDQRYSPPSLMQKKIDNFLRTEVPESTFDHVSLSKSACLQILDKPYHMLVRTAPGGAPHIHTINKLFFYDTFRSAGKTLEYLNAHSVTYAAYRAMNFYICANSQHDYGMVYALLHARKLLGEYTPLESDGALYEPRVRRAVEEYYTAHRDTGETRNIEELMRMFEERNARLDVLVENIARSLYIRAKQKDVDVPVDISARTLFLTMSAYSSLFLAHNIDKASPYTSSSTPSRSEILSAFDTAFTRFPRLIEKVEIEEILDDVRTVRMFDAGAL